MSETQYQKVLYDWDGLLFNPLFVIGAVILAGFLVSRVKVGKFHIGVTSVLIVGIIVSLFFDKFGIEMDYGALATLKNLGLSVFIYLIGLSVGPFFFRGFREGRSLLYNGLALAVVGLGFLLAWLICRLMGVDAITIAGVYTGSVGSTPGMSSAQDLAHASGMDTTQLANAFAVTYFIGTFLPIACIPLLRWVCGVRFDDESRTESKKEIRALVKYKANSERFNYRSLILLAGGLAAGMVIGYFKVEIGGFVFTAGSTLGVLLVGIGVGFLGPRLKLMDISLTNNRVTIMLREIGVALFLAAVGLEVGKGFTIEWEWVLYGIIISFVPIFTVGWLACKVLKMNFFTLVGVICGATTDTSALAYAESMDDGKPCNLPSTAYAAVYPLTLLLRVITAQLLVMMG